MPGLPCSTENSLAWQSVSQKFALSALEAVPLAAGLGDFLTQLPCGVCGHHIPVRLCHQLSGLHFFFTRPDIVFSL